MLRLSCRRIVPGLIALSAALVTHAESTAVRFVVVTPDSAADAPNSVYVASSVAQWQPDSQALAAVAPGVYVGVVAVPAREVFEYKFTRQGTWETVEKAADGGELPNRRLGAHEPPGPCRTVVHIVARWADRPAPGACTVEVSGDPAPASQPARAATRTGDIRVHAGVASPQLGNRRDILVWLPPGYDADTENRYPVLYLHDGQNVFDAATSFPGVEWAADETADRLIRAGRITPLIIVAVANTPARLAEYTPWPDAQYAQGGRGDDYLAFLVDTVKPLIDGTYRTRTEREHTAIGGSSLGGLISFYALARHPDVFGRAAAVSPSLWWADGRAGAYFDEHLPPRPVRLWIDTGTEEGARGESADAESRYVRDCRHVAERLRERGYREGVEFYYDEVPGAGHNERAWAARFDRMLLFLFGTDGASTAPVPPQP